MRHFRLESVWQDLRFGFRQLNRHLVFTVVAVTTLALGIGATTAIFSVVYYVVLRPLPFASSERILRLQQKNARGELDVTYGHFAAWVRESRGFEALGALSGSSQSTLTGVGDPTPVFRTRASAGYWKALRMPPVLGRYYGDDADRIGAPKVAVLSYALWRNMFGGDTTIIGRSISLDGESHTVVGVAPPEYVLVPPAERVWVPLAIPPGRLQDYTDHELTVYGLVRRGTPAAAAVADLAAIDARLAQEDPNARLDDRIAYRTLREDIIGPQRALLFTLSGAVGFVLLIACANVANLLLARSAVRRSELALRRSLGATPQRIVRQMLVEGLLIGVGGAAAGLVVAIAGVRFLTAWPSSIPRLQTAAVSAPVLAFMAVVAVLCSLAFSLLPALRSARFDLQSVLHDGGRGSSGMARERTRAVLIVAELCLAQILLVGAGLLIRSAIATRSVPPGFATKNVLAFTVRLPSQRYRTPDERERTFEHIEATLSALPGVESVGRTLVAPIYGSGWNCFAFREGSTDREDGVNANFRTASPTYFATIKDPMISGRTFSPQDRSDAPPVAIVSASLAKQLYGDANPIGQRITNCYSSKHNAPVWREIVGVVGNIRANGLTEDSPHEIYFPTLQWPNSSITFVVRGSTPVATLVPSIRRSVAGIDPLLALLKVQTMDEAIAQSLAVPRFTMWLLILLGGVGLTIAVVGIYGVVAYFVSLRSHDLGIRLALGATSGRVQWMVVREGLILAALGVGSGIAVSIGATNLLKPFLFSVGTRDPWTFAAVGIVLCLVAIAASYVPARRATRIDPLEALRS